MDDIRVGDEVLGPWLDDGFYYPAIVVELHGPTAHLAYLDGAEDDVPLASLHRGRFALGTPMLVNWKGKGTYYRGIIAKRVGAGLYVHYEDGEKGWTTVAQCRLPAAVVHALPRTEAACSFCGTTMDASSSSCDACGAPRARVS